MGIRIRQPLHQAAISGHSAPTPTSGAWHPGIQNLPLTREAQRSRGHRIPARTSSEPEGLDIHSPATAGAVIDHLRFAPVLIVLPPVYALLAAPTGYGVAGLNRMKKRLPGKNYGTAAGELSNFWEMVDETSIPSDFEGPNELESTHDVFFRCRVSDSRTQTQAVRNGTHQTLILSDPYRSLMCEIEAAFRREADPALFGGHSFSAPLITSCNLSGDPLGSITDKARGHEFIHRRNVGLWVRESGSAHETGSYPILELEKSGISIQREGGSIRHRELYKRFQKRH
ncbi:MAG TPA: hypothetical protein EYQ66_05980 [Myxococcales bacterium]|nr:hypothetical protein [Myxococcales bacterium]